MTNTPANASTNHSFLIPSATGPVHYPACAGPITWTIASTGITESGSTLRKETAMWQSIFTELSALTDYTFMQVPSNAQPAPTPMISIFYASNPSTVGEPTANLAAGTAGLGGITELSWNGTHWVANASVVILNPNGLRSWNYVRGLRSWVAHHELGHALGLGHADDPTQIMTPQYNPLFPQAAYQAGDIAGLQALARTSCANPKS